MSQRAQSLVWERSRAKGSQLLVLLAIADYARNDGRDAWPSAQTLAKRARLTDRATLLILHALEQMGEILIELNTELRRLDEHNQPPRWFLHVRCVCDWPTYEAEGETASAGEKSEKFSDSEERLSPPAAPPIGHRFRRGRRPGNPKSFLISRVRKSEKSRTEIRNLFGDNPKSGVPHPYDPRTIDPRTELKAGGCAPDSHQTQTDAEACFTIIVKLAHTTLEQLGESANEADLLDDLKRRCHKHGIPSYPPADLAGKALDAARWQRRNRSTSA